MAPSPGVREVIVGVGEGGARTQRSAPRTKRRGADRHQGVLS